MNFFQTFVVQAIEGTTPVPSAPSTITASDLASPAVFTPDTVDVTVVQPAVSLSGFLSSLTTLSPVSILRILVGLPSPDGRFIQSQQAVRAGGPILMATVTNSAAKAGQLVIPPPPQVATQSGQNISVPITPGQPFSDVFAFDPFTTEPSMVSVSIPGFLPTANATLPVNVSTPMVFVPNSVTVGAGLQSQQQFVQLTGSQHGGVTIHLESSHPAVLLLSPSATTPNTPSRAIDIPVLNGITFASYFVQGLEGMVGSAVITASAEGFLDGSGTVNVLPPAVEIVGVDFFSPLSVGSRRSFQVRVGIRNFNGSGVSSVQAVRTGGPGLMVMVTNSDASVGQLETLSGPSQQVTLTLAAGQSQSPLGVGAGGVDFVALAPGATTVQATGVNAMFLPTVGATRRVDVVPGT